ncbi:MAG: DUF4163 domain-containing protein [Pelosinus sp.]|nr:DUF4163 domain-containing protein [Pelosinus sp.]
MKKKLLFFLLALIVFSLNLSIIEASPRAIVEPYDYQEDYITANYPHLDGMANQEVQTKMNYFIEGIVNTFIAESQKGKSVASDHGELSDYCHANLKYEVQYNNDNLLSLTIYKDVYLGSYFSGAHGHMYLYGYTFNLDTGNTVPFSNFVNLNTENRKAILNDIFNQAQERKIRLLFKSSFKPIIPGNLLADKILDSNYTFNYYLVSKDKSMIIFEPYEAASFAEGILKFSVNLSK